MMRSLGLYLLVCFATAISNGQPIDTTAHPAVIEPVPSHDNFFSRDLHWRGADGAASLDLGNGRVLWLFSDTFVRSDPSLSRKGSDMIRNSIAIQEGYDIRTARIQYYTGHKGGKLADFFYLSDQFWFWTGHAVLTKDRLIVFLMKMFPVSTGLGFEARGWYAAVITNPKADPAHWNVKYVEGPNTFGTIAGSAAVLKEGPYIYVYGAVEPSTHEVYLLRWPQDQAYEGNFSAPEWWIDGRWTSRERKDPAPKPLFIGATEYSVYYDPSLGKYIQVQGFGFGSTSIGIRISDRPEGPWSEPRLLFTPDYSKWKRPLMYSVKAHPELSGAGVWLTYNVNSFDFGELVDDNSLYFPKFVLLKTGTSVRNR